MKKWLLIIGIGLSVVALIFFNLPFEVTRCSDIKWGNKLIAEIENYKLAYKHLPRTNDHKTLERLGFDEIQPIYEKINKNEYQIIFLAGFDPPYLYYNSEERVWKYDFPKIAERVKDEQEEDYPWTKEITEIATDAILYSIENVSKPISDKDINFPTDLYNMPFLLTEKKKYQIIGYSFGDSSNINEIEFQPIGEYKSGPRITVDIDIKNKRALRVYMKPDA